jgi:hypothetical protein
MSGVEFAARIIPPGRVATITRELREMPSADWMVEAFGGLLVEEQVLEEWVTGSPDHEGLLLHATVRNPHPWPVAWDRLAVEL